MTTQLAFREPTADELQLLTAMSADASIGDWLNGMLVAPLSDGGMGSLRLAPGGFDAAGRRFGQIAAERKYHDSDGVEVVVSLLVDDQGKPYELDVWKVDFTPVSKLFA